MASLTTQENVKQPAHLIEHELMLCCARTVIDAHTAERIQVLLRQDIAWAYLIEIATRHQVTPLLCSNLCAMFSEACPTTVLDRLKALLVANAARNLFLTHELIKLFNLFEAHEIPVIPYKGPILTNSVYGQLVLRWFADLDILVHKRDHHRVTDVLVGHGWRLTAEHGWERTFEDASGSVHLDVHEGLTHKQMPFALDFNQVWTRCVTVSIFGKCVRTFAPSHLLIVLCVQLAAKRWTARSAASMDGLPAFTSCPLMPASGVAIHSSNGRDAV